MAVRVRHPNFVTYYNMRSRVLYKKSPSYKKYGAKGITICARWLGKDGFTNFIDDMGARPSPKHSLDRIDSKGNYEPKNCRWATNLQQRLNQYHPVKTHSGYHGVFRRDPKRYPQKPWWACIGVNGKQVFLGSFEDKKDAAHAYNKAVLDYYGEEGKLMLNSI